MDDEVTTRRCPEAKTVFDDQRSRRVVAALQSSRPVSGLTHGYYRYPAAFSPDLAHEVIGEFSTIGDLVLDPFSGGGTTLVEAVASGRRAAAIDINTLAAFVGRVKTRPLSASGWVALSTWAAALPESVGEASVDGLPGAPGTLVAAGMNQIDSLPAGPVRAAGRCVLLRFGQWALESCHSEPDAERCSRKLVDIVSAMKTGMDELVVSARVAGLKKDKLISSRRVVVGSSDTREAYEAALQGNRPSLVLMSPPYPRVHVLYSRWQVRSRKETSLPYEIAACRDGSPPSYYTMGSRSDAGEAQYFRRMGETFGQLIQVMEPGGLLVQVVGFNRMESQLDRYQHLLLTAGFRSTGLSGTTREVPNRRWYARGTTTDSALEYLLVHEKPR